MRKLLIILLSVCSYAAFGQAGSPTYGGVFLRVTDTTTYQSQAAAKHAAGYADMYWNAQATVKHFDFWNGTEYEHLFSLSGDFWPLGGTASLLGNVEIHDDSTHDVFIGTAVNKVREFEVHASQDMQFNVDGTLNFTGGIGGVATFTIGSTGVASFNSPSTVLFTSQENDVRFFAGEDIEFDATDAVDIVGDVITFDAVNGMQFTSTAAVVGFDAGNANLSLNDGNNGQVVISGNSGVGNSGVIIGSVAGSKISINAAGTVGVNGDMELSASDDIDLDPEDDLMINGVSGTTGQFIGNVNGHAVWTTPTGTGYSTVEDEGVGLTQRTTINFAGAGVTAADSGGETLVTIPGGTGHSYQFNVMDYGATGDGTTDDTGAFQDAFDAACAVDGDVIIPPASVAYRLNSTVEVHPCSGGQIWVDVKAYGDAAEIKYYGADNTAAFEIWGLKGARWDGMNVEIVTGCVGCIAFDIDTDAAASSTSNNTFANMRIHLGGSAAGGTADLRNEDCIGIRTGFVSGGNGDISHYIFENVSVYGGGDASGSPNVVCDGQYGFQNLGANTLSNIWLGGFVAQCERAYSNITDDGTTDRGNAAVTFLGMGGSGNDIDFVFSWEQTYNIEGGRFESGNKFLHITNNGNYPQVTIQDISIRGYKVATELMLVERSSSLVLDNVHVYSATPFTGMINITANHHSNRMSVLSITNSAFEMGSTVPYPFVKTGQVPLAAKLSNNVRLSAGLAASYFLNIDFPGSALDIENTQVGNVTTGEDQLYSYTLMGGAMYQDEMFVRMRFSGSFANNGNTKTLRVKFGGTTMVTRTLTTPTNGTGWSCYCEVYRTGATTQDYNCTFVGLDPAADASNVGTASETLSGNVAITVTGDATATDDITKHTARVNFND